MRASLSRKKGKSAPNVSGPPSRRTLEENTMQHVPTVPDTDVKKYFISGLQGYNELTQLTRETPITEFDVRIGYE